ncbi:PAS domain S-box protein [Methanobacterium sp.]|uniref:sensor histidine kinase n=1 Tax=Methanobacterium sp. TaxID=2164 RepID=UPI003C75E029
MDNIETIEILLFEDNPGDTGLIEFMLEESTDFSYELKNVETLDEGLKLFKYHSFDIILLDLGLPDSDGIETFIEVNRECHETPIIILTGLTDEKTGINAVKMGAQDYLIKGQVESTLLERSIKYSIERKKAEEKIQIFANIVESSDDAIITKSFDGTVTSWNRGAEHIYGYSSDEIIGKPISLLESDIFKGETKRLIEKIKNGERIRHYETLRLKKDNTLINVSITLSPVFDTSGELVAISTIARDITEKKRAEEDLKLANRYNRSLIEASLDPLVTIGPDGKINDVNYSTELITGYARDELIGTDFSDYFTEPEKAREVYQQVFQDEKVFNYALEIKHRKGHVTPVLYNASVYRDESDDIIGIFAAARDITERKQAEEKLKEIIEELERSNYELQQFAYITSHDLQEPLRTIASYTQLIERRYRAKLDDDADEFIDFIVEAAVRMKDMIQGLLYYSRVGTKGGELKSTNTEKLLEIVLYNLNASIKENNVTVTHDKLPLVVADEGQFIQLFQNLISNAIKFKRDNEYPKVHISANRNENEYIFSVADNGIGIDSQYFNRIFEVFKRLHTNIEYDGTGIGLSISKRIIERHGGRMWVESEEGKGSIFYFTIPII